MHKCVPLVGRVGNDAKASSGSKTNCIRISTKSRSKATTTITTTTSHSSKYLRHDLSQKPKTSVKYYENEQNLFRTVTDVIIQIIRYENTKIGYNVHVALILIVKISVNRQRLEQLNSLINSKHHHPSANILKLGSGPRKGGGGAGGWEDSPE